MAKLNRRTFLKIISLLSLNTLPNSLLADEILGIRLPVLLYHEIAYRPLTDYTVKPHQFLAQMELLRSLGYLSIFPWEVNSIFTSKQRAFILTFDDGSYTFLEYAYPILKEYGLKVIMNVIGSKVSRDFNMISWDEYREILGDGFLEIGCHSYDFHYPGWSQKLSLNDFKRDLRKFKEIVHRELGKEVKIFASPLGENLSKEHYYILEELGFEYIFLSEGHSYEKTYYRPFLDKRILHRLNINHQLTLKDFKTLISYPFKIENVNL